MSFKITELYAFAAVADDGDEGIASFLAGDKWMPMVAADKARLEQFTPIAKEMSKATGKTIRVLRFSNRETIETIGAQ